MRGTALAVLPLIFLWFAQNPVSAHQRGMMPHLQLHAVNPSLSLSAPVAYPLLQQSPSGVGRQELAIGRELNTYTGRQEHQEQ